MERRKSIIPIRGSVYYHLFYWFASVLSCAHQHGWPRPGPGQYIRWTLEVALKYQYLYLWSFDKITELLTSFVQCFMWTITSSSWQFDSRWGLLQSCSIFCQGLLKPYLYSACLEVYSILTCPNTNHLPSRYDSRLIAYMWCKNYAYSACWLSLIINWKFNALSRV